MAWEVMLGVRLYRIKKPPSGGFFYGIVALLLH